MTPRPETIWQWPLEWLTASSARFNLRSFSQSTTSPWSQSRSVYGPHAQMWVCEMTMTPRVDTNVWRAMAGLLTQVGGVSGLLRVADVTRLRPQRDLEADLTVEAFSDGTFFDDGTGWTSGYLPEIVFLAEASARGADSAVIGGLPISSSRVLRRGDLFEIRPAGVYGTTPHLYMVMFDCPTDANGKTRAYFRPGLRSAVAAGDAVVLKNPQSVFRLADDEQGFLNITPPYVANFGFKLVEAVV